MCSDDLKKGLTLMRRPMGRTMRARYHMGCLVFIIGLAAIITCIAIIL
jgi:uncharacterized membrane protein YhaH (DUF805 family)